MPQGNFNPQQLSDLRAEVDLLCRELMANPTDKERQRIVGRRLRVLAFLLKRYDHSAGEVPFADLGGTPDAHTLPENEIVRVVKHAEEIRFANLEPPFTDQIAPVPEADFCNDLIETGEFDPLIDSRLYKILKSEHNEVSARAIFKDIRGYNVPKWIIDGKEPPADEREYFTQEEILLFTQQQEELKRKLGIQDDNSNGNVDL